MWPTMLVPARRWYACAASLSSWSCVSATTGTGSIQPMSRWSTWGWASCASAPRRSAQHCRSKVGLAMARRSWLSGHKEVLPIETNGSAKGRFLHRRLCIEEVVDMSEPNRVRVLIVDDHAVVRSGLGAFLAAFDDLELVGEAASGKEAVRVCDEVQPDVVLMDLMMPDMQGTVAMRAIRQQRPQIQVIALTSFREDELVHEVFLAGAIGYLLKNVTADELADAIRAAYAGRPTLAPEVTEALMHGITHPPMPSHDLTAREREVLALMVKG